MYDLLFQEVTEGMKEHFDASDHMPPSRSSHRLVYIKALEASPSALALVLATKKPPPGSI
jgi:hypothetical protein